MPFYEMTLVLRPMPRKDTVEALRRAANLIWKEDGVLRKVEYLGFKKLAYAGKTTSDDQVYKEGDCFIYHISLPQLAQKDIVPELKLDTDIIRSLFFDVNDTLFPKDYECTLEEELQTPFYRKSVQPLLGNKNVRANVRNFESIKRLD